MVRGCITAHGRILLGTRDGPRFDLRARAMYPPALPGSQTTVIRRPTRPSSANAGRTKSSRFAAKQGDGGPDRIEGIRRSSQFLAACTKFDRNTSVKTLLGKPAPH